jgi:hypothetical protein
MFAVSGFAKGWQSQKLLIGKNAEFPQRTQREQAEGQAHLPFFRVLKALYFGGFLLVQS